MYVNANPICFSSAPNISKNSQDKKEAQKKSNNKSFLDKFETSVKNSADMNDTIQVPRTIFKGYLAFTVGTALVTIAAVAKTKHPKLSNLFNVLSAALVMYGTYSFVRPYLINPNQQK